MALHTTSGPAEGVRATVTPVTTFSYVPPSAAKTAEASFALTPHPSPTATVAPTATVVGAKVSFTTVQQILVGNCAGCHPPVLGMNLSTGHVLSSVINVPSREFPSMLRIKPGDPNHSYLYLKVAETKPPVGVRMPRDGLPLTNDEIATLRAWIEQGAHP
ncbi:MAG: cytochrome c [Chloroflexi bacterium]|nr:cytochrome c [Chloroflexota bacterium]